MGHTGGQTHAEVLSRVISRGCTGEILIAAITSMPVMTQAYKGTENPVL